MTFQNLDQIQDEREIVALKNDMEFWTNGDLARFGIDVREGRCVEMALEDLESFSNAVNDCETGKYSFDGRFGTNTYLFESEHPNVHIYHNQKHVMSFTDYEKYPLSTIQKRVKEERINWDVEKTAEKVVSDHTGVNDNINVTRINQQIATVEVRSEFFKPTQLMKLASINSLHRKYTPNVEDTKSESQFIEEMRRYLENINATVNDDGSVEYTLQIDTSRAFEN